MRARVRDAIYSVTEPKASDATALATQHIAYYRVWYELQPLTVVADWFDHSQYRLAKKCVRSVP